MQPLSLKRNFAWTFAGQIAYALAQWLVITLIARYSSVEVLGQYALALAICGPVVTLADLRLRSVQASDSLEEFTFFDYLFLRVGAMNLAIVAISVIAIVLKGWNTAALLIIIIGGARCIESLSDVIHGYHQRHERMDRVSLSFTSRAAAFLLLFVTAFLSTGELLWGAVGILGGALVVLLFVDIPLWNKTRSQYSTAGLFKWGQVKSISRIVNLVDFGQLNRLFRLSVPLGLTSTIGSLSANVPRYFLEYSRGAAMLGVYVTLIYPLNAGNMMMSAIAQSAAPRLSNLYRGGDVQSFQRLLLRLVAGGMGIGLAGVLATILAGGFVLELLYGPDYAQYRWLFVWAMANAGIGYCYLFLGTALNAMKLFSVQLPIHFVSLTVLTLSCWIFIRPYGLSGAMLSLTLAYTVEAILYAGIVVRRIRKGGIG